MKAFLVIPILGLVAAVVYHRSEDSTVEERVVEAAEPKKEVVRVSSINTKASKYRAGLTREAQAVFGLSAPIPMFAGQIHQESSWRTEVTAWDHGRGLAQFMDATAKWITQAYPELGPPNPYNPQWAMRAMVRLNKHNFDRVKGANECEKWGAALKGYNAGLGYVLKAQRASENPLIWFGLTEYVKTNQSPKNFEYSRMYPRKIIFKHQSIYSVWGQRIC